MKLLTLSFAMLICVAGSAQKNIPVLIKAGFGLSNVKANTGKANMSFAASIGVESYIPVSTIGDMGTGIAINPDLSYLKTGYESSSTDKVVVNYLHLALPVFFVIDQVGMSKTEDFGFGFGLGPFVGLATSGKFRVLSIDPYKKMSFGNGVNDNRTSMDAGLVLKSFFRLKNLNFGTQYNLGFSNLVPKDRITNGASIKSRNFLVYVSYAIFTKKK